VIDGDTIRVYHKQPNVRLVGFNAPETRKAQSNAERGSAPGQRVGFAILFVMAISILNLLLAPARRERKEHRLAITAAAVER
jgi:hypothetical protein